MKPLSLISAISVYSLYTKTGATLQRNPLSCDNAVFRKEPRVMKTVSVLSQPPNDTIQLVQMCFIEFSWLSSPLPPYKTSSQNLGGRVYGMEVYTVKV